MTSETVKEMLNSILELEEIKASMQPKPPRAPNKIKLNYLFPPSHQSGVKSIASNPKMEGFSESEVARAALMIGIKEIERLMKSDTKQARGIMHIARLREKLQIK